MDKFDIRSASYDEMCQFMEKMGEKAYRGGQIFDWINNKFADNFDEMTNISQGLRSKIAEFAGISHIEIVKREISSDNSTKKFLFKLENYDTIFIEAVLMSYKHGFSVCLSTQAGCRMGCDFCASADGGLVRNLTAGEIAAQLYKISKSEGIKISNVVLMGVGEPLDNFDNVMKFVKLINCQKGQNLSQRGITLSTCGLVPQIYAILEANLQLNLAISLHAPNDEIRQKIMPIARKYSFDELLEACRKYAKNRRRITFEYIMIDGINDKQAHAEELVKKLKGIKCHFNLILANEIPNKGYNKSKMQAVEIFKKILENGGFRATIRRELGADITAACGQLRNEMR